MLDEAHLCVRVIHDSVVKSIDFLFNFMTVSEMFAGFMGNLVIENRSTIGERYERITSALNRKFRNTESKTANSLQIGSLGRKTAIKGLSDLDMIYILPKSIWGDLKDSPYTALSKTKGAIDGTYPATSVSVDRLVVVVKFTNYVIEVQPCFEQEDGTFLYPDTYRNQWLPTMPREEMQAVEEMDSATNKNYRDICKMTRAWRNKHGLKMGGLLVDTLAYQFFSSTNDYDATAYSKHDQMALDFFTYLSQEPTDKSHYKAPGSRQNVRIKKRFQKKAKKAIGLCESAIAAAGQSNCTSKWRKVFGRPFPLATPVAKSVAEAAGSTTWRNTEEFIEDRFSIDIRYNLKIDCEVSQTGYRTFTLRQWLIKAFKLKPFQSLKFYITTIDQDLSEPYEIYWKILNRGEKARQLDQIRGQIVLGTAIQFERSRFKGGHIVECYIVKNNVVMAKDRIDVPIDES